MKLTNEFMEEVVNDLWHWRIEDNLPWKFCSGILEQNYENKFTPTECKKCFQGFFKNLTGYKVFTKCPKRDGEIIPIDGPYGYFVGFSEYPKCDFKGSRKRKKE